MMIRRNRQGFATLVSFIIVAARPGVLPIRGDRPDFGPGGVRDGAIIAARSRLFGRVGGG
jgi:hypothetical protein